MCVHTTDWRYGCRVLVHVLKHVFDLGHSLDDPWGHLTGVKVQPGAPGLGTPGSLTIVFPGSLTVLGTPGGGTLATVSAIRLSKESRSRYSLRLGAWQEVSR